MGGNISVMAVNSCGTSPSQTLNVLIPIIDITTNTIGNSINSNQSGAAYQWLDCSENYLAISGETNSSYSVNGNGEFAVAINLAGCVDTSECVTMTILKIETPLANSEIQIFPNPTLNRVNIECLRPTQVRLYNSVGQLLEIFMVESTYILDMENYAKGIYYLLNNDSQSVKVIKQ